MKKLGIRVVAGLLALVAAYLVVSVCGSTGTEVCDECGVRSHIVRLAGLVVWRSVETTPLSRTLTGKGIVGTHSHHWLFAAGAGFPPLGPMCMIGSGRYLGPVLGSGHVAAFLTNLSDYADRPTTDHYRRLALTPRVASRFDSALFVSGFPESGFADAAAFHAWWTANRAELDDGLTVR